MQYRAPAHSLVVILPVLLAGCASVTPSSPFHAQATAATRTGLLSVRNADWEALTIYLDRQGSLLRLGVVEGNGDATFRIPPLYLPADGWVSLVARQTGGRARAASELFSLSPGQSASWSIPLTHGLSAVTVFDR